MVEPTATPSTWQLPAEDGATATEPGDAVMFCGKPVALDERDLACIASEHAGDIQVVARFRRLESLVLHTDVATFEPLRGIATLRSLSVVGGSVTDLEPLATLHGLEDLSLFLIQPESLRPLAKLKRLKKLGIGGMAALPDLAPLGGLTQLVELSISSAPLVDADLLHLRSLVELRSLSLVGTSITDAGLGALAPLRKLHELHLADTAVTEAGAAQLRRTMPSLKIGP